MGGEQGLGTGVGSWCIWMASVLAPWVLCCGLPRCYLRGDGDRHTGCPRVISYTWWPLAGRCRPPGVTVLQLSEREGPFWWGRRGPGIRPPWPGLAADPKPLLEEPGIE